MRMLSKYAHCYSLYSCLSLVLVLVLSNTIHISDGFVIPISSRTATARSSCVKVRNRHGSHDSHGKESQTPPPLLLYASERLMEQLKEQQESTRRDMLQKWSMTLTSMTSFVTFPACSLAQVAEQVSVSPGEDADISPPPPPPPRSSQTFVEGTVSLPPGSTIPVMTTTTLESQTPALYITARPDKADNVPRAILEGSRGKPPPVLAARISNPVFPFSFSLTDLDLTVEGASKVQHVVEQGSTRSHTLLWWKNLDLVISARWDSDGVAATRDPNDLVGRGIFQVSSGNSVMVPLQGRGLTGKFVTGKSSK